MGTCMCGLNLAMFFAWKFWGSAKPASGRRLRFISTGVKTGQHRRRWSPSREKLC